MCHVHTQVKINIVCPMHYIQFTALYIALYSYVRIYALSLSNLNCLETTYGLTVTLHLCEGAC